MNHPATVVQSDPAIASRSASPSHADLVDPLSRALPELSREDVESLSRTVYSELELRVGTRISDGLSDTELEQFEALVEAGDDAACAAWLGEHRPDYAEVVASERNALLLETVTAIRGDSRPLPETVTPPREEMVVLSEEEVLHALKGMQADVIVHADGTIRVTLLSEDAKRVTVTVNVSAKGVLCLQSDGVASYTRDYRRRLLTFAQRWNHDKYWPKAFLIQGADRQTYRLVAEVAFPLGTGVPRRLLAHFLGVGLAYSRRMFDELDAFLADAATSAQLELF